jgi:hypothetical protein
MALCRCDIHPPANNRKHRYYHYALPIGYPQKTSSICGRSGCERVGRIYLRTDEVKDFKKGERIFCLATSNEIKMMVENTLF